MKADPKLCSMEDCNLPLGPDALEFTHKGEDAGGICEQCLAGTKGVRVLFVQDSQGKYVPEEMANLDKML